jgi:hypothetical protein
MFPYSHKFVAGRSNEVFAIKGLLVEFAVGGACLGMEVIRWKAAGMTMPVVAIEFIDGVGGGIITVEIDATTIDYGAIFTVVFGMTDVDLLALANLLKPNDGLLGIGLIGSSKSVLITCHQGSLHKTFRSKAVFAMALFKGNIKELGATFASLANDK